MSPAAAETLRLKRFSACSTGADTEMRAGQTQASLSDHQTVRGSILGPRRRTATACKSG